MIYSPSRPIWVTGEYQKTGVIPHPDHPWTMVVTESTYVNMEKLETFLETVTGPYIFIGPGLEVYSREICLDEPRELPNSLSYGAFGYVGNEYRPRGPILPLESWISCTGNTPAVMEDIRASLSLVKEWKNPSPVVPGWTLVTGFFDFANYPDPGEAPQQNGRSTKEYLEQAEFVLSLRVNLCIFCDAKFADYFLERRKFYGLDLYTTIYTDPLSEYPYYQHRKKLQEIKRPGTDPRCSPIYQVLVCSKFSFLEQAIRDENLDKDEAQSTHFGWIDIGISKVTGENHAALYRALQEYRDPCSFCYIDYTPPAVMNKPEIYYQFGRCGTAGGFFTGSRENMAKLCSLFTEEMNNALTAGWFHAEEQLIPPLYHRHPELFQMFFGDYSDLLMNYDRVRSKPQHILQHLITHTREYGAHQLCSEACERLYQDAITEVCTMSPEEIYQVLNEWFIAEFYRPNGQVKSRRMVEILSDYTAWYPDLVTVHSVQNTDFAYGEYEKVQLPLSATPEEIRERIEAGKRVILPSEKLSSRSYMCQNPCYRPV